ncbi:MAG: glycosyltransferase family 4 protein [Streptosporangiaceae bacterium]
MAFALVSYQPDEPAGMERAVAALAVGLRTAGHRAVVLTAAAQDHPSPDIIELRALPVCLPCDDVTLRAIITAHRAALALELNGALEDCRADVIVYVDALWGLGSIAADISHPARRVLAAHVLGHPTDLAPALRAARCVIAPSEVVLTQARNRGYDTAGWRIVPNPLLIDPDEVERADPQEREQLRRDGPVRIVARLGPEKGVTSLLRTAAPGARPVQVVLASAGFEANAGSQQTLLAECRVLAGTAGAVLYPPLAWRDVPTFLAGAAVTLIPSAAETFGNLALESLSAGTPVVAFAVGNLPALIGTPGAGVIVPVAWGTRGLWQAAQDLLADRVRYRQACGAAYCRSRNYRSTTVAEAFLKAVW